MTGRAHAHLCGWDPAKTSRIELGRVAPSANDIRTWCRACSAHGEADYLVTSLRAVEAMYVEWRRIVGDGQRQVAAARMPVYERTAWFRAYSSWLIPGMIQTAVYTEQVLRAAQRRHGTIDDIAETLASREARRKLLTDGGRVFAFVVEESVLRTGVGDSAAMAEQLRHLIEVASLPNVSLGIVPAVYGREHRPVEDFWIFDKAQVNVELVSGYLTVTHPSEVAAYARTFSTLASLAVSGADARALITAAIDYPQRRG